jgi:hypothetical protein
MNAEQVLKGQKPTVELIRDYVNKNPVKEVGFLITLSDLVHMNQSGSKYNAMDKLQLVIICHNLADEFYQLDRLLYPTYSRGLNWFYENTLTVIRQTYGRVTSAAKYKNHDHFLDIKYTSKRKEK